MDLLTHVSTQKPITVNREGVNYADLGHMLSPGSRFHGTKWIPKMKCRKKMIETVGSTKNVYSTFLDFFFPHHVYGFYVGYNE